MPNQFQTASNFQTFGKFWIPKRYKRLETLWILKCYKRLNFIFYPPRNVWKPFQIPKTFRNLFRINLPINLNFCVIWKKKKCKRRLARGRPIWSDIRVAYVVRVHTLGPNPVGPWFAPPLRVREPLGYTCLLISKGQCLIYSSNCLSLSHVGLFHFISHNHV